LHTQPTENRHALCAAFLARHYGTSIAADLFDPTRAVTSKDKDSLVTAYIMKMRGTTDRDSHGHAMDEPLHTISAGGTHFAQVQAFLIKYFGTDQDPRLDEPLHTITSRDRFGL